MLLMCDVCLCILRTEMIKYTKYKTNQKWRSDIVFERTTYYDQCQSSTTSTVVKSAAGTCFARPSPRPRGSARRKTASSLILRGHF